MFDPDWKLIPLSTRGLFAKVDSSDYDHLMQWNWYSRWNPSTQTYYATRSVSLGNSKQKGWDMQREIMNPPEGMIVDHKTPSETLDNRRLNLRLATCSQNCMNQRKQKNNTTGFKGVSKHPRCNRWRADIKINRCGRYLGLFASPELAYAAYCEAAKELHGEFARLA